MAVTNLAELDALVARVKEAQREFASFSQEQVDKIFRAAALAAAAACTTAFAIRCTLVAQTALPNARPACGTAARAACPPSSRDPPATCAERR